MTTVTRVVGILLVVLGVGTYGLTGADSPTALLPALLGLAVFVCGLLAGRESIRRHVIHAALALALVGFLGTLMNVAELPALLAGDNVERPGAVVASTLTALVCAVYVGLGVRSFIAARRQRTSVS